MRAHLLDLLGCLQEVNTVVGMLIHTCANGENVWIKNDVFWWEVHLRTNQDVVGSLTNANLLCFRGGLAVLVKGHDHHGSAMLADDVGMFDELLLTNFERDGVDDRLPLAPLQSCLNNLEL